MNGKKNFFSLTFILLTLLLGMSSFRSFNEALAQELAPKVLRFHILANSDSRADQDIKLEIRSLVLDYLRKQLPADSDKQDTIHFLTAHRKTIEALADRHLAEDGFSYHAQLELTNDYFPTRCYNGNIFPCGNYDAARITLGSGRGHNWWCVLYPRYCFADAVKEKTEKGAFSPEKEQRPILKFRIKLLSLFNPHSPDL